MGKPLCCCAADQLTEMKCKKNGVLVINKTSDKNSDSLNYRDADLYECPSCLHRTLLNFGESYSIKREVVDKIDKIPVFFMDEK